MYVVSLPSLLSPLVLLTICTQTASNKERGSKRRCFQKFPTAAVAAAEAVFGIIFNQQIKELRRIFTATLNTLA